MRMRTSVFETNLEKSFERDNPILQGGYTDPRRSNFFRQSGMGPLTLLPDNCDLTSSIEHRPHKLSRCPHFRSLSEIPYTQWTLLEQARYGEVRHMPGWGDCGAWTRSSIEASDAASPEGQVRFGLRLVTRGFATRA